MTIVGYGLTTKGEAGRYMEATLKEFQRLCDKTVILCNNCGTEEFELIKKYGFDFVIDDREWGNNQHLIKEEFIKNELPRYNPDYCLCLDMDEVFDEGVTKEYLKSLPESLNGAYFYFVTLWNDEQHQNSSLNFWNVRYWKFSPDFLKFKHQPLHCYLVPEVFVNLAVRLPHIVKHYGLMKKEDRDKKVVRYEKYDPHSIYKGKPYYDALSSELDGDDFQTTESIEKVVEFVNKYKEGFKKMIPEKKEGTFYYLKNKKGLIVPVEEKFLQENLSRGLILIGKVGGEKKTEEIKATPEAIRTTQENDSWCPICGFQAKNKAGKMAHTRIKHDTKEPVE